MSQVFFHLNNKLFHQKCVEVTKFFFRETFFMNYPRKLLKWKKSIADIQVAYKNSKLKTQFEYKNWIFASTSKSKFLKDQTNCCAEASESPEKFKFMWQRPWMIWSFIHTLPNEPFQEKNSCKHDRLCLQWL